MGKACVAAGFFSFARGSSVAEYFVARPRKSKISRKDFAGGSPAAGHFSCAAKKSNQKKAAPGCRAPRSRGNPALPDSTRRLWNSTWQGTHNVPCHGTRTVLAENPLSSRAARRASRGEMRKSFRPLLSPQYSILSIRSSRLRRYAIRLSHPPFQGVAIV